MSSASESWGQFLTGLSDLWADAKPALPAFVIALLGVFVAKRWFEGDWFWPIVIPLSGVVAGQLCHFFGDRKLPNDPVKAVEWLELWVIAPATLAAAAAAFIIILGFKLTVKDPGQTMVLLGAVATGVTAFLTSGFISWAGDEPDSKVATRIRSTFWAHYKRGDPADSNRHVRFFPRVSTGERWVYSERFRGIEGWGREARRARAKGIEEELSRKPGARPLQNGNG